MRIICDCGRAYMGEVGGKGGKFGPHYKRKYEIQ